MEYLSRQNAIVMDEAQLTWPVELFLNASAEVHDAIDAFVEDISNMSGDVFSLSPVVCD